LTDTEPLIRNLADTARWVAVYRAQESERPDAHFRDPFARRLAGERGEQIARALPFAKQNAWSFVTRTVLVDRFITEQIEEGTDVVINLAAGLDARPYRMALPAALEEHSPRLLLLMIGGNDFLRRLGKEQAEANVRAMVKLAKDRGVDVVLIGTPEPGFTVSPPGFYANIASEFRIPYEEDVIGAVLKDSSLKSDQIHPNASGYRLVAERVAELLRKSGAI